jgi:hypothetical protein
VWSATLPSAYTLTCGGEVIAGPWQMSALAVSSGAGPKTVWAAFHHHTKRPSMVLEILPGGRQTIRYIQAGWIMGLAEWTMAGKPTLVASGVINEQERASLVTFDPSQALTMMEGGDYTCDAPGALPPSQVTLFPPHDVTAAYGYSYYLASNIAVASGGLTVKLAGSAAEARIAANGAVSEISFTDDYRLAHDRLFREGRITHAIDACPTLAGPQEIQTWAPAEGWGRYLLPATSVKGR